MILKFDSFNGKEKQNLLFVLDGKNSSIYVVRQDFSKKK